MQRYKLLLNWFNIILIAGLPGEFASLLTLKLLGIENIPYPWSVFIVLFYGFYGAAGISLTITAILALAIILYSRAGFQRVLAYWLCVLLIFASISFLLGLGAYYYWEYDSTDFTALFSAMSTFNLSWLDSPTFVYAQLFSLSVLLLIPSVIVFERIRPASQALGNAHFANGFEVKQAGFFKKTDEGILIGKKYNAPLFANGFEHVLVFAPSGSGKTRSIAIPNLFNYPYSIVCNDIKFTLYEKTSGYREKVLGHRCYCFAPARADGKTHRFNPLSFISHDKHQRITDIQRIAHILIPDNPKTDPIWTQASRKLFKALVLFLLDSRDYRCTLGEINRLIKQQQFDSWLHEQLENTDNFDPEFYRNGYSYINNHEKTRSSILETFSGYFELFDDPIIDAATSDTDFDLRQLRRQKMTIYVGFTDDDMERLAPLLTLFWQQLISVMIQEVPDIKQEPYPLLCLIDEFSSLGRIERLRRSLKLLREYRVRCILMFQYIAQTYEKYSHDEARAFTNIKTKIAYSAEDINDAEFISKILGTRTKRIISRSVSNQHHGTSDSQSIQYQAIPLMRSDDIMKMPEKKSLIMRTGNSPVKADQYIWYQDNVMKNLVFPPVSVPIQKAQQFPFIRNQGGNKDDSFLSCLE